MTPLNFVYWLQGFFELAKANGISSEPYQGFYGCVQAHIDLCKKTMEEYPGDYNSALVAFLGWMESAIEFNASFGKMEDKLNSMFEHVIDPMTPDVQGKLSQAHQSHGVWLGGSGGKC